MRHICIANFLLSATLAHREQLSSQSKQQEKMQCYYNIPSSSVLGEDSH